MNKGDTDYFRRVDDSLGSLKYDIAVLIDDVTTHIKTFGPSFETKTALTKLIEAGLYIELKRNALELVVADINRRNI